MANCREWACVAASAAGPQLHQRQQPRVTNASEGKVGMGEAAAIARSMMPMAMPNRDIVIVWLVHRHCWGGCGQQMPQLHPPQDLRNAG